MSAGSTPSTRARKLTMEGLQQVLSRLDVDVLAQPEFDDAMATFQKRIERPSKGLGARNNTLSSEVAPLTTSVETTLIYPRTKGTAWQRKLQAAITAMAPNVIKKAAKRIEERWSIEATAAEGGGSDD